MLPISRQPLRLNRIGLIGSTSGAEVIEYYKTIQKIITDRQLLRSFEILIYSLKSLEFDDDPHENIIKVWEALHHMACNGAKAVFICNHEIQMWANKINEKFPLPLMVHAGKVVVEKIMSMKLNKLVVFSSSLTNELSFLLTYLQKASISIFMLPEKERLSLDVILKTQGSTTAVSIQQKLELNNMLAQLPKHNVDGILVDSPELQKILKQLYTNIPILYTREAHAASAIEHLIF